MKCSIEILRCEDRVKRRAEHEVLIHEDKGIDRHKDGQLTEII